MRPRPSGIAVAPGVIWNVPSAVSIFPGPTRVKTSDGASVAIAQPCVAPPSHGAFSVAATNRACWPA